MADQCPTARLYEELSGFIAKSGQGVAPGCETMQSLMCIIQGSSTFARHPAAALETLLNQVGPTSRLNLTEAECEGLYKAIRPFVMAIDSRQESY